MTPSGWCRSTYTLPRGVPTLGSLESLEELGERSCRVNVGAICRSRSCAPLRWLRFSSTTFSVVCVLEVARYPGESVCSRVARRVLRSVHVLCSENPEDRSTLLVFASRASYLPSSPLGYMGRVGEYVWHGHSRLRHTHWQFVLLRMVDSIMLSNAYQEILMPKEQRALR